MANANTWPDRRANDIHDLRSQIEDLASRVCAWRGLARTEWQLESTFDREIRTSPLSDEDRLKEESKYLRVFNEKAIRYASDYEQLHLAAAPDPQEWGAQIWQVMALGRHAGLATRLLDWTASPWVAAWFACHEMEHKECDGVVWWFSQPDLEKAITWNDKRVPRRETGNPKSQRAIEKEAFSPDAELWITKVHFPLPVERMAAQQGFATVCSRLGVAHNAAIDQLKEARSIPRGRIVIPGCMKEDVLGYVRTLNVHAGSLKFPGIDIAARSAKP
jgi:hypothetical protein